MKSLRVGLSKLANKKVPALSLFVVAILGMVAGVLAAAITVSQTSYTGEKGTFHNNSGTFTITDVGLRVVANAATSNVSTSVTFGATGTDKALVNTLTAGNWMDVLEFTTTLTGSTSHTATITVRSNTGPLGSTVLVSAQTATLVAPSVSSTAKITIYLDLGAQTITAPLTVYVNVS